MGRFASPAKRGGVAATRSRARSGEPGRLRERARLTCEHVIVYPTPRDPDLPPSQGSVVRSGFGGEEGLVLPLEFRNVLGLCFGEREAQVHHGAGADFITIEFEAFTLQFTFEHAARRHVERRIAGITLLLALEGDALIACLHEA